MSTIGINTWVWTSPLTDESAPALLRQISALGFDAVELPLESAGDLSAEALRPLLAETGLAPFVVGAMGPGRELCGPGASEDVVASTQDYLRDCIDLAADIAAPAVCGPFYSATGRTWRADETERRTALQQWRDNLAPVIQHASDRGVTLGIEPLNRYETSLINTVEQGLEALDPLGGGPIGLALDTYHLAIEERSIGAAIEAAGDALVHLQVCGNDRGAPGGDQIDWPGVLAATTASGYRGPWNIESFTAENATIAVAASIWRPLAPTQDDLARDGLAFLRDLLETTDAREQP